MDILLMVSAKILFPTPSLPVSGVSSELIPSDRFRCKLISNPSGEMKKWIFTRRYLLLTLSRIGTRRFQSFAVRLLPWKGIRAGVELVDTMHNASVEIIKARKLALEAGKEMMEGQVGRGKDIISILC
jgi:hypothetical protein